jgi:hypothetical protein
VIELLIHKPKKAVDKPSFGEFAFKIGIIPGHNTGRTAYQKTVSMQITTKGKGITRDLVYARGEGLAGVKELRPSYRNGQAIVKKQRSSQFNKGLRYYSELETFNIIVI